MAPTRHPDYKTDVPRQSTGSQRLPSRNSGDPYGADNGAIPTGKDVVIFSDSQAAIKAMMGSHMPGQQILSDIINK